MKSIRKKFFVMLLSAMLLLGISSNVQAAGCSDYYRISTGTAKCTIVYAREVLKERKDKIYINKDV